MGLASTPPFENIHLPQPTIEQNQKTASNDNAKFALGIAADSLENKTFADIDKQTTWKYSTSSGHPTLKSTGTVRDSGQNTYDNNSWQANYEAMLPNLGLTDEQLETLQNPTALNQDPELSALNDVVINLAKAQASLDTSATVAGSENIANESTVNGAYPDLIGNGYAQTTESYIDSAKSILATAGPNLPGYDALMGDLNSLQGEI